MSLILRSETGCGGYGTCTETHGCWVLEPGRAPHLSVGASNPVLLALVGWPPGLRLPEAFRVPREITPTLTSLTSGVLAGRLRGVVPASPHVARAREMM